MEHIKSLGWKPYYKLHLCYPRLLTSVLKNACDLMCPDWLVIKLVLHARLIRTIQKWLLLLLESPDNVSHTNIEATFNETFSLFRVIVRSPLVYRYKLPHMDHLGNVTTYLLRDRTNLCLKKIIKPSFDMLIIITNFTFEWWVMLCKYFLSPN